LRVLLRDLRCDPAQLCHGLEGKESQRLVSSKTLSYF
jgi:hypothetical protein